jgi:hypothetical protein
VYVDHASRLGYVYLQKSADADETVKGKLAFEAYAESRGISIKAYHADNGIFRAKKWLQACEDKRQRITFTGVHAHHTNGMAEKRIRDLQDLARAMLLHANSKWNTHITANLWPYAIRMANEVLNSTPCPQLETRQTPQQVFDRTKVLPNPKHFQPFGCPVYVLATPLQAGMSYHKWKERARVGIYLGPSPLHGRNIALVLDPGTGLVSPQHNVRFDSNFDTVKYCNSRSLWQEKAGFLSKREKEGEAPTPTPTGEPTRKRKVQFADDASRKKSTSEGEERVSEGEHNRPSDRQRGDTPPITDMATGQTLNGSPGLSPNVIEDELQLNRTQEPAGTPEAGAMSTNNEPIQPRLVQAMSVEIFKDLNDKESMGGEIFCLETMFPDWEAFEERNELLAMKASADPDTMYHHEAMRQPDREEFKKAMQKEIDDQMANGNFTIVRRTKVPKGATVLPAVWQMKRKRDILSRQVKKWKARLNVDGSRMKKGIHYDQTYAPVASWTSIRTLLALTAIHNWHTVQLDYVLAFPQAPVEKEIYMEIPRGVKLSDGDDPKDFVLKLNRNVYGQKQAGRVWNKYLVDKLVNEVGFKQSEVDECVFYKGNMLYVLYTDDSIIAGPDKDEIYKTIKKIQKAGLNITVEGDLQDFLGINIQREDDGSIYLSQPHLIEQILRVLRLDGKEVKEKDTPAKSSVILNAGLNTKEFDESFNYRSIIGKLNYLERGTRSDISYIVHQCARFTSCPKEQHAKAIRWLGRYLRATKDKGLRIKPKKGRMLEVYVDADFAGNFDKKESHLRDTARSRHGYIIMYEGVPITWKSQLQTEIALSSTESEYTGLSYALREAIPIMHLLKEMKTMGFPITGANAKMHCKVFEDNSGALEIAKIHKYRPRTKHLNVKLHHFRDYVTRGEISINPINTKDQLADYLTKPVNAETLEKLRKEVMGW